MMIHAIDDRACMHTCSSLYLVMSSDIDLTSSAVQLPNGVRVPNRLVKASMEEGIGTGGGLPGKHHQRLYSRWAEGGWGMIITGLS
jgi:2,4-dienoyl-CoA reductase-like NADH-dependent reductase (Old Yellow Enzyme family)